MNNSNFKTAIFWVVIIVVVVLFWTVVHTTKSRPDAQLSYTQLMNDVNAGKIKTVSISGNDLHGTYKDDNQELHADHPQRPSESGRRHARQGRGHPLHQGSRQRLGFHPDQRDSVCSVAGVLDLHDAADAERREQGAEFRQEPGAPAFLAAEEGDVQGRGRRGRGQGRAAGDYRIPARAPEVPETGRTHSQGRAC